MDTETVASLESSEEAGLEIGEEAAAAIAAVNDDDENINTSAIDMLQEHEYNNEDGSVDLAPELNVDENTILLPVAGENGLNADDPAIAFSASDFLQEEEEVIDPMDTNVDNISTSPVTRSNRRNPSQFSKKWSDVVVIKYEREEDLPPNKKRKRRGRKPGSKVINGQVFYPTDEQGITFSKNAPKTSSKPLRQTFRSTARPIKEEDSGSVDESQCRVCMSTVDLLNVFKKEHTKTFAEKLMVICPTVSIQRKDFLPQFICRVCASSVNAAFALKAQCEQTDIELRERLERSLKRVRRPMSNTYVPPESEPEDNIADFKLSDASPPSADDSDSDYGKPLAKRRTRRRTRKTPKAAASTTKLDKSESKSNSSSPAKKNIKAELDLNTSKSSEQDAELAEADFSSGSEEDYSPPKKRLSKKSKSFEEGDGVTCRICNVTVSTKEELRDHKKSLHSHHECELCGRKFRVMSSLKAHMEKHTQTGELKCEACDKHFRNKTERRKHMVDVHNESPAQYVCDKCKRAFTTEVRLLKHNESRCPGFDTSLNKKRIDLESLAMGKDLFKCVAPLTTTYWSDSFSD